MAAQVPASESIDVANWDISKDAFAPPTTRRVIRGWDRTAVSSHAPRLLRRKVWKVAVLKPMKGKAGEEEVQEELQKDGIGARKKPRKINAKENIGNPAWDVSASGPSQDISVYFQKKDEGSPAAVTEDETFTAPQEHPDISDLQFVPRKRTNTNHVITPRKSRRRAVLAPQAQQEPFAVYGVDYSNRPRRRGKSLRKSIRKSTGKASPVLQGTSGTPQLLEHFDHRKENNMALPNEPKFYGLVAETESLRSTSDFLVIGDSPESIVANLDEALAGTSPFPNPDDLIWSANTEEEYSTDVAPAELCHAVQHEAMDLDSAVVKGCEESQENCLVGSLWEVSALVEPEGPGPLSIPGPDLRAGKEVQEDSTDNITYNPAISTRDCELEAFEASAKFDTALDVTDPVGLTLAGNSLLGNGHIPKQTNDGDPQEGKETPAAVDDSSSSAENTDFTQATTSQSGAYKSLEVTEFISSEEQATNMGGCETLNIKTDEEADVPLVNIPMTTYDDDHEDTDMLRNFLTRVKANKAAKKSPARRRRSLAHSPLRTPLGEADSNTSPSPEKPGGEVDRVDTTSSTRGRKPRALGDEGEAKNRRSSRRTRLPGRATPCAPSVIPVRRLDQDVPASAPVTRKEDKETAALTRVNTRKNKGEALPVGEVLAKRRAQNEDPAMRQRLLKEAFDVKTGRGRGGGGAAAKTVTWAEELVQFRPATEQAGLPAGAAPGPVDEERRPGAVRVGVRRKMALGMAVNGTKRRGVRPRT